MTYTIYELKLKPLSGWITDLTADTIFGHLCWQIKYKFGDDDVLKKFLEEMEKEPIFVLSDVLPADRLPRPLTEFDNTKNEDTIRGYNRNKKYKEIQMVLQEDFKKYFLNKELNSANILIVKKKIKKDGVNFFEESIENKNIIDRTSFTTGDNGIYSQNVNIHTGLSFSLYIKIFDEDKFREYKIEKLLKNIFEEIGYGKKKSTGKGNFEIENINKDFIKDFYGIESNKIEKKNDLKNILLLSNFIPSKNDSTNGNYKLMTKFPKLGEEFSIEGQNFYKKPLVMIQSGATFENNGNGYVGKMLKNVDFQNKGIYHYAYGFTLEF